MVISLKIHLHPAAPPCPWRYLTIYSSHGSQQAPLHCQHFLLLPCSMCQAKEKQQRLVLFLEKTGFCGSHWAVRILSCTHRLVLCPAREPQQTHSCWDAFAMESIPWNVCGSCTGTGAWQGLQKDPLWWQLAVAAEPGRLRCVSCPQPPIVTGNVVTSSALNLSPYFALPSWW